MLEFSHINISQSFSVEGISIPKEKLDLYKKMETNEAIVAAEKKIGFSLGRQTKHLFLKLNGLYYGTWEFRDLEESVGNTLETYSADDRLAGKKIDKFLIASDGMGNNLCVDANDMVFVYQHDANPVFWPTKKNLVTYINEDFREYIKQHPKPIR